MKRNNRPDWMELLDGALNGPARMAEYYSVFHEYSIGNQMLAALQLQARGLPIAPIATLKKWNELGRWVKKGEKAISLIMPIPVYKKVKTEENSEKNSEEEENDNTKRVPAVFFVLKPYWFSLDQTTGKEYTFDPKIPHWDKNKALETLGISEIKFEYASGNTQGFAVPDLNQISISPIAGMPHKTLFHEIAHCLLHKSFSRDISKNQREAEAEIVAYLCCAILQLPGLEESCGYIRSYLRDNKDSILKVAPKLFATADKILKAGEL